MSQIIPIFGIVVTGAVALIVAYLHRKQMRQIEAHREDSSVPLKPPASPFWRWLGKYSYLLLMVYPIFDLCRHGFENKTVTILLVIDVALQTGMVLFLLNLFLFERLLSQISAQTEVIAKTIELIGLMTGYSQRSPAN